VLFVEHKKIIFPTNLYKINVSKWTRLHESKISDQKTPIKIASLHVIRRHVSGSRQDAFPMDHPQENLACKKGWEALIYTRILEGRTKGRAKNGFVRETIEREKERKRERERKRGRGENEGLKKRQTPATSSWLLITETICTVRSGGAINFRNGVIPGGSFLIVTDYHWDGSRYWIHSARARQ